MGDESKEGAKNRKIVFGHSYSAPKMSVVPNNTERNPLPEEGDQVTSNVNFTNVVVCDESNETH